MNYIHIHEDSPEGDIGFPSDFVTDGIAFIKDDEVVRGFYRPLAKIDLREQAAVLDFSTDRTAILTVSPQMPQAVDDTPSARRLLKRMATAWLSGEAIADGCEVLDGPSFDVETLREEALKHGSLPE